MNNCITCEYASESSKDFISQRTYTFICNYFKDKKIPTGIEFPHFYLSYDLIHFTHNNEPQILYITTNIEEGFVAFDSCPCYKNNINNINTFPQLNKIFYNKQHAELGRINKIIRDEYGFGVEEYFFSNKNINLKTNEGYIFSHYFSPYENDWINIEMLDPMLTDSPVNKFKIWFQDKNKIDYIEFEQFNEIKDKNFFWKPLL